MSRHENRIRATTIIHSLILCLALALVALQVHGYTKLSPIDELQHIDYLYRAPSAPEPDDRVGQDAMRQQDCRGVDAPGFGPGACRPLGSFDPTTFQEKGYNTAAANTPIYYSITRGLAEVIKRASPANDLVTAGRLAGGLWFALGLFLTYVAGRKRGVAAPRLLAVMVLLAASPALIFPSATITPDAAGLAVGALVLLVTGWWEARPGPRRTAVLVTVATVVSLIKLTNLVVVAAVALYLLMRPDASTGEPSVTSAVRRRLLPAGLVGATPLAAAGGWMAFVSSRPQIPLDDLPDMMTRFHTPEFPWNGLADNALVLLQPLASPGVTVGSPQLASLAVALVSTLLVAGTLGAALFSAAPPAEAALARAVVGAAIAGSAMLVVMGFLSSGSYFPLPPRYSIALVAPMAVVTAACLRPRSGLALFAGVAVIAAVTSAVRLSTLT
jgi:hypothetical protein